jgi:hypothetical protein
VVYDFKLHGRAVFAAGVLERQTEIERSEHARRLRECKRILHLHRAQAHNGHWAIYAFMSDVRTRVEMQANSRRSRLHPQQACSGDRRGSKAA